MAISVVEPLGAVTGPNRNGADRPGLSRRAALINRHPAGPLWEPLGESEPESDGFICADAVEATGPRPARTARPPQSAILRLCSDGAYHAQPAGPCAEDPAIPGGRHDPRGL